MQLKQILVQRHEIGLNPMLGLSPLELELLLSQSLEGVVNFYEQTPGHRGSGNYYFSKAFSDQCRRARGQISPEAYLQEPQVIVQKESDAYAARYNEDITQRIKDKLSQFQAREDQTERPIAQIFSRRFEKERSWMAERQQEIVKYVCEMQQSYLESGNIMGLTGLSQQDIADHSGLHESTVCRLTSNLTVQLPNGKIIFIDDLIPANTADRIKGTYALKELAQDPELYEDNRWKVSAEKLRPILKERFGIDAARRTVAKYQGLLKQ